jgi:hypothetical protein
MENVKFVEVESFGEVFTHAIITREDGSELSMLKSTYDAMQAEQSTPNLAVNEAKTK